MKRRGIPDGGSASILGCMLLWILSVSAGRAATPLELDGCVLWLDASDTGTVTELSGLVVQWDDKSASGADVSQGTSNSCPQIALATLGTNNVLAFDGNDWLGGGAVLNAGDDDYTYVVVWRPHTAMTSGGEVIFEQAGYGTGHRAGLLGYNGRYGFIGESNDDFDIVPFTSNTWRLTTMVLDGTQWDNIYVFDNGDDWVGGAINKVIQDVWSEGIRVGAKFDGGGENLDGDVAEIIVYSRPLTRAEINDLHYYLDQKWEMGLGITPTFPAQIEYEFEDGTLQGWTKTGGTGTDSQPTWSGRHNFAQSGKWFIGTAENETNGWGGIQPLDDGATFELTSPSFSVSGNTVRAMIGGGNHDSSGTECRLLMEIESPADTWHVVRTETGPNNNAMREYMWNIGSLSGANARFRVVDNNTETWGHLNVDAIRITSEARPYNFHSDFSGNRLDPELSVYRPFLDPGMALTGSGTFRIDTSVSHPGSDTYDLWSTVNRAPQLRLATGKDAIAFVIETHVVNRSYTDPQCHSGLLLSFADLAPGDHDFVAFGPFENQGIWAQGPTFGDALTALDGNVNDVYLRIERKRDVFGFFYSTDGMTWTSVGTRLLPDREVLYAGLYAKGWSADASPIVEFDYLSYVVTVPRGMFLVVR